MKYLRWSIWEANLEPVIGSEQGKIRPVLIISNDTVNELLPVVNVLPITSRKFNRRIYPNEARVPEHQFGLHQESIILCYQIRTLDKKRLSHQIGNLNSIIIQYEILDAICFQLEIKT